MYVAVGFLDSPRNNIITEELKASNDKEKHGVGLVQEKCH
jgi:hypothetical protein